MDFESLPPEIKSHIFSYLSIYDLRFKVARVSKKWQTLSRDPHVVKHIEIDDQFDSKEIIQCLMTYNLARSLQITEIFDFNWVLDIPLNNNLRRLHIDKCCFEVENLQILSTRFPMISKLKLLDCKYLWFALFSTSSYRNISSNCLRLFAENCKRLEDVEITICYKVDEMSCQTLLNLYGPALTKLILFGEELTDNDFTTLSQCWQITDLHLCYLSEMTDSQLLSIKDLRSLRKLFIMGANNVSGNAIFELFTGSNFPHLQSIILGNCNQLSDDFIALLNEKANLNLDT